MTVTPSEVQRRSYLDGLRGGAACMVFCGHLTIALMPAVVTFTPTEAHSRFDIPLGMSPLSLLWAANFAVCLFFILSGFVLSDFCRTTRLSFPAQLVRRYLRLALPMLITSAIACIIMMLGLYKNLDAAVEVTKSGWLSMWYRGFDPGFLDVVRDSFYGAFDSGKSNYNSNLWTMQIELIGSAYVFLLHALFRNKIVKLLVLIGFVALHLDDYYALFAIGVVLNEFDAELALMARQIFTAAAWRERFMVAAFGFGLFLGAFPFVQPGMQAPLYSWLSPSTDAVGWHKIGATILVAALLRSALAQRALGGPVGTYFGRISFVLYLIHLPIICCLTAWVAFWMKGIYYPAVLLVDGGITIATVLAVATLLYRYVDLNTTAISRAAGKTFDHWLPVSGSRIGAFVSSKMAASGQSSAP